MAFQVRVASSPSPAPVTSYSLSRVAADALGNLFFIDVSGAAKFNIATQQVTRLTAFTGLSSPKGVAVNPCGTLIYVSDYGNHRILLWNTVSATLSTAVATGLSGPSNLVLGALLRCKLNATDTSYSTTSEPHSVFLQTSTATSLSVIKDRVLWLC